jgi:hypothetical protein
MRCPIKTSKEWQDVLAEAGGNEQRAYEIWEEKQYDKDPNLNEFEDEEEPVSEVTREKLEKDKVTKLVNEVRTYLEKKLKVLERTKVTNQKQKQTEVKEIIEQMKVLDGVDSINLFVRDAYDKAKQAHKHFNGVIRNIDKYDRKEAIQELIAMQEFANRYSILDEIQKSDIYKYFSNPINLEETIDRDIEELTPQEMLTFAKAVRDNAKSKFVSEGIPLMADFLLDYKPMGVDEKLRKEVKDLKARIEVIKGSTNTPEFIEKRVGELEQRIAVVQGFSMDKQSLINTLESAAKDTSVFDYLTGALISSPDAALGMFARAVKTEMEGARQDDIAFRKLAAQAFEEYSKSMGGLTKDNPAKFNEGIYEDILTPKLDRETGEVLKDKNGKVILESRTAFVQKYDITKYKKAEAAFYRSLGKRPNTPEALEQYNKRIAEWYASNTVAKSQAEIDQIILTKEKEANARYISKDELAKWKRDNISYDRNGDIIGYKRELTNPNQAYANPKWDAMYDKNDNPINPKGKYHKFLLDSYLAAQENLPDVQKPGYVIPSIEKTDGERLLTNGVKDVARNKAEEFGKIKAYDVEYGVDLGLGKEGYKYLPVYYVQPMDTKDVSLNLMRSVLMFNSMANNYNALNQIYSEINLFKAIIGEREVAKTNAKGIPIVDSIAKNLGYQRFITENGSNFSAKRVNDFIDMVVYGEMKAREELGSLSADKIVDKLMGISAITTIALDVLKGVSNNLQGNIQVMIEAASGEFFGVKDLANGKKDYWSMVPGMLSDFGKFTPESLGGQLFEQYDPIQGEYKDSYGRTVTGSIANKLFSSDTLFFNQHFGEHEIQLSTLFAMLNNVKVIDNETQAEITLMEAYKKYGVAEIMNKTDFTEQKRIDIQNKIHALNKRLHGIYNNFDKSVAQKYTLGRLAFMYRKYLIPSYTRRFKKLGMDQELGSMTEGYYRTFWNQFAKDLITFKSGVMTQWKSLSDFEKAQVRRTLAELGMILALWATVMALKAMVGDDDDDELKQSYAYNFILYEAIRMNSETKQYLPGVGLKDVYKVVKSPSAMTSTMDRMIKFVDQFAFTWDPEKLDYQRKAGVWEKGDNKSWAYFLKLIGYSGNNIKPDQAIKSFEAALNR